jgi:hypothetical protein
MERFVEEEKQKPESDHQVILEQYAKLLPNEGVVPDNAFEFLATQVQNLNALSTAANIIAMPLQDKAKTLKDMGEILTPIYGEAIFLDFQNALAEDNFDVAMQLLVGSTHLDKVAERYWSSDAEGQVELIESLVGVISGTETAAGTDNEILKLDLISKIFDKIIESPAAQGKFTSTDAMASIETLLSELAIGAPVLKVVKDMVRARRLSRLFNIDLNSPADLLEKPKAKEGEWFGKDDPIYKDTGTTETVDIVTTKSPSEFEKLMDGRDIKDVTDAMGASPEDMPSRILPHLNKEPNAPAPSGVHHHHLSNTLDRKIQKNHMAVQLQEAEVDSLLPSFVADISIAFGDSAVPHLNKSYFEDIEDPTGNSLGIFVVRLGEGTQGGFKTADDATLAAKSLYGENVKVVRRTSYGNFSDDLMEGTNAQGQYFIELRQEHQFTPKQGKGYFLGEEQLVTGGSFKPVLNFVLDDDYLFNDRIQKTYSNIRDRANAFGVELSNQGESLIRLATSFQGVEDFNRLMEAMDVLEVDDLSVTQMTSILGHVPDNKTLDALDAARLINAANWEIKNNMERAALVSDRYKTTFIGEERYISRPLLTKPDAKDIKGSQIYDPESGTSIPLNQQIIDGLYEGGGVVSSLYKNVKTPEGEFTHIIVRNPTEQIKELQPDVLPYVKGHVQRIYKDDGFVVTGVVSKKVNGQNEIRTKASQEVKD